MHTDATVFHPVGFVEVYGIPRGTETNLDRWRASGERLYSGPNQTVFSGIDLVVQILSGVLDGPGLNGMYLEFENTADPSAVVIPGIDNTKGVEYYRQLASPRDYLRVPLQLYGNLAASDSRYKANKAHYLGNSGGASGVNGLAFSALAGSAVYGAALVKLGRTPADDIVYARSYMTVAKGVPAEQQIGVSWISVLHHKDDAP